MALSQSNARTCKRAEVSEVEVRLLTVWGHTGNTPGYTQFAAASSNGRNSVIVSINDQLSLSQGAPGVLDALREAEELAVCAALAE